MHWRRKWQPTPVFLPGESQGRGSLVGCRLWVAQSWTRLKWLSNYCSHYWCSNTLSGELSLSLAVFSRVFQVLSFETNFSASWFCLIFSVSMTSDETFTYCRLEEVSLCRWPYAVCVDLAWVALCSLCVPRGFAGRMGSEVRGSRVFPHSVLAVIISVEGGHGFLNCL